LSIKESFALESGKKPQLPANIAAFLVRPSMGIAAGCAAIALAFVSASVFVGVNTAIDGIDGDSKNSTGKKFAKLKTPNTLYEAGIWFTNNAVFDNIMAPFAATDLAIKSINLNYNNAIDGVLSSSDQDPTKSPSPTSGNQTQSQVNIIRG